METVANCFSIQEAMRLRTHLEGAGIPCFIPDENAASVAPHFFLTQSGVRLQVAEEDVENAKKLLEVFRD